MVPEISPDPSKWILLGSQSVKGYVEINNSRLSSQGMAIYKDRMFNFFHNGYCMVHKLEEEDFQLVSEYKLDIYGYGHHLGIISIDHRRDDGVFLYTISSKAKNQCLVLKINEEGSEHIQTIVFPHSSLDSISLQYCIGDGFLWERVICGDANNLSGDGICILRKYEVPDFSQKEVFVEKCLNEYIIANVYSKKMRTIQGFKIYKGIMYALFGNSASSRCLQIIDIEKKMVVKTISLDFMASEPEDCDIYDGSFYMVQYPFPGVLVQNLNINN